MRILGIDCGSQVTGYGVIDSDGASHSVVDYGVLKAPGKAELAERLGVIADGIDRVLSQHSPDEVAVEDVFYFKNVKSAIVLAHVRGAVLLSAARAGLVVASYAPRQVKQSVTGYGSAEKEQVTLMVQVLLGVQDSNMPLDASDALAVACCHATRRGFPA